MTALNVYNLDPDLIKKLVVLLECYDVLPYNANLLQRKSFTVAIFAGKLLQLYSNSKHLIIRKKKICWKTFVIGANPRKFSTANDLHYTVYEIVV